MCEHHVYIEPAGERSVPRGVLAGRRMAPAVVSRPALHGTKVTPSPELAQAFAEPIKDPQKSTKERVEGALKKPATSTTTSQQSVESKATVTPPASPVTSPRQLTGRRIRVEPKTIEKPAKVKLSTRAAVENTMTGSLDSDLHRFLVEKFREFCEREANFPQGKDKKHERQREKAKMLLEMQRGLKLHSLPPDQAKAARIIRNQFIKRMPLSMSENEIDEMLPKFLLDLLK